MVLHLTPLMSQVSMTLLLPLRDMMKPDLGVGVSHTVFSPLGWLWPREYQSIGGEEPWWVFGAQLVLQGEVIETLLPSHGYLEPWKPSWSA